MGSAPQEPFPASRRVYPVGIGAAALFLAKRLAPVKTRGVVESRPGLEKYLILINIQKTGARIVTVLCVFGVV